MLTVSFAESVATVAIVYLPSRMPGLPWPTYLAHFTRWPAFQGQHRHPHILLTHTADCQRDVHGQQHVESSDMDQTRTQSTQEANGVQVCHLYHYPTLGCDIHGFRDMGLSVQYWPRWLQDFPAIWLAVPRTQCGSEAVPFGAYGVHLGIREPFH